MIKRGGLPLRWRVAVLTALAIALLSVVASVAAYLIVRSSLIGDLKTALKRDVQQVAQVYSGRTLGDNGNEVDPESGPTGVIIIQVYDTKGQLLAASNPEFELAETTLPEDIVLTALESDQDWRGELNGKPILASLAAFNRGAVAVMADTTFIRNTLTQLAEALLLTALFLIAISALAGYLVAVTAMRPVTRLAALAAELGPDKLDQIAYKGPNDEVGQLTKVLNDLLGRLGESLEGQRIFLAESSHELRTPLTSLQGFLERASRRADPNVKRDLDDAKRISQTMSRLVADLLQLSRGELVREMVPHLVDPVDDILIPVSEEFPGVKLKGRSGETIVGDPERLRQLIRNLVSNAVRATQEPNKVTLEFRQENQQAILEVQDSGPGIPQDVQNKIFDKFYKGPGGGAGLGLAIAKQIAHAHSGTLELDSKVGRGTTFRLSLSMIDESEEEFLTLA